MPKAAKSKGQRAKGQRRTKVTETLTNETPTGAEEIAAAMADTEPETAPEAEPEAPLAAPVSVASGMAHATRETGQPGDVAIRDSWLINPADIVSVTPRKLLAGAPWEGNTEVIVATSRGSYALTPAEAAQLGITV